MSSSLDKVVPYSIGYYECSIGGTIKTTGVNGSGILLLIPLNAKNIHFKSNGSCQVGIAGFNASLPTIVNTGAGRYSYNNFEAGENIFEVNGSSGYCFIATLGEPITITDIYYTI